MDNIEQENIQENSKNTEQCLSQRNTQSINLVNTPPDKEHDRLRAQMHIYIYICVYVESNRHIGYA